MSFENMVAINEKDKNPISIKTTEKIFFQRLSSLFDPK